MPAPPVSPSLGVQGFGQALDYHLRRGTRPKGSVDLAGKAWTNQSFATAISAELTERTVRNWRGGRTLPSADTLAEIEQALFGENAAYEAWRLDLREAHARARRDTACQPDLVIDTSGRQPCNLPYASLARLFKGREGVLARLHATLAQDSQSTHAAAVIGRAVHGLGGIGKTRLAVEYAWQQAEAHSALLFTPADTPERLDAALAALASPDILALPEHEAREDATRIAAVFAWLARHPGWLLILDNVDDKAALEAVRALLLRLHRAGARGQVLITGRLSTYPPEISTLELDVLPTDAAAAYLLEATATRRRPGAEDETLARELAVELGGLALGLSQAAAFVNARRIGFTDYLGLWRSSRETVLGWFDRTAVAWDCPGSVDTENAFA